ncbi:hypothetical protein [Legionella oakridgensis]|uniref:hypothetical protein n=1 Tax=Legionella oakridgensis TaxID=29423 RepID=UPI0003DE2A38|nr:hypothetical protein [Legionella oakridgensis]ETO92487.1 hypothetical protein LOR_9c00940 [Legionella oakridgensis RV-2-2007]
MDELDKLLRPSWEAEKWIQEGWKKITEKERTQIKKRISDLFKKGLPFELKQDKRLLYVYTFSLLAQLEVLAIQVPLTFEEKLSSLFHKELMHNLLVDEIFRGILFTRILYILCAPHALPPAHNENIEILCNFIRNEDCPKIAIVLLNLNQIWIEEIFQALQRSNIAPNLFATILNEEHRLVCEADLERGVGLPDADEVHKKFEYLEEQLLKNLFLEQKSVLSVCSLLGAQGTMNFIQAINERRSQLIDKINIEHGETWKFFMKIGMNFLPEIQLQGKIQKMLMWPNPDAML